MLLYVGFTVFNQPEPPVDAAKAWYTGAAVVAFAGILYVVVRGPWRSTAIPAFVVAMFPMAAIMELSQQDAYGPGGWSAFAIVWFIVVYGGASGTAATIVVAAGAMVNKGRGALWGLQASGIGIAMGSGFGALWLVNNIEEQAELVRAAHEETTPLPVVVVLTALAVAVRLRRIRQ